MRLTSLLPLLAAAATAHASAASDTAAPTSSPSASDDPPPAGALWTATWDTSTLTPYTQSCHSTSSFRAQIFKLAALYPDLEAYATGLKRFYANTHYPGSWGGHDAHGMERELLMMEVADLPARVRQWMEKEGEQKWYSVQGKTVFFAPGAVYPLVPLWVDAKGEGCEDVFNDLATYSNEPKDGTVIGKVSHKEVGKGEVEFTVEALRVQLKEGERDEL
jgi:hypothetical protein